MPAKRIKVLREERKKEVQEDIADIAFKEKCRTQPEAARNNKTCDGFTQEIS